MDGTSALRHAIDRRESAAREKVTTNSGNSDGKRQTEKEDVNQLLEVLRHRALGSRNLHHDRPPANSCASTHDAIGRIDLRNCNDMIFVLRGVGEFVAFGNGIPARFGRVIKQVSIEAPHWMLR